MTYKELGTLDSSPEQHLGLSIAHKLALNAGATVEATPGGYLAGLIGGFLDSFKSQHVSAEQGKRISDAFAVASDADKHAAAAALKVSIDVIVPDSLEEI